MKLQFMRIRRKEAVGGSSKIHQLENNFHNILTSIFYAFAICNTNVMLILIGSLL